MRNKFRSDKLANKSPKIGCNRGHPLPEVISEAFSVLDELVASFGPLLDLEPVSLINIHSHGDFCGINDILGNLLIQGDGSDLLLVLLNELVSGLGPLDELSVDQVVVANLGQLREVPGEPLLQSHAERVYIFVQLLDQRNRLRNGLVVPVDVLGHLVSRERMSQTKLGLLHISFVDLFKIERGSDNASSKMVS